MIIQKKWKNTLFKDRKILNCGLSWLEKFETNRLSQATYFHRMLVNIGSLPAATISLGRADLFLPISHFTMVR
jgi:hypothetical protein